jgi:hypothetical protein
MMYVPFPRLTEPERLNALPAIDFTQARLSPADARERARMLLAQENQAVANDATIKPDRLEVIRLVQPGDTPVYALRYSRTGWIGIDARQGARVVANEAEAKRAVAAWSPRKVIGTNPLIVDQWSVYPGLKPHRPLFVVDLEDGGRHYVSSRTGELVRDTSRFERGWNWVGSVTHWIYVTPIRENGDLWHWVVVVLSGYAIIVALLGTVLGVIRFRKYGNGRWSPYRGWMRWHHILGLIGAIFVFSWLVSGLLSMNPGSVFARADVAQLSNAWRGATLDDFSLPSVPPASRNAAKEIEWHAFRESAVAITRFGDSSIHVEADTKTGLTSWSVDRTFVESRAATLAKARGAAIASIERLDEHDLYYYPRTRARPLPAWRIALADDPSTWWHIDGTTGEFMSAMSRSNRVERWLYNGLHSWDFAPLLKHRPWSWDVPMLFAMAISFVFSITCVVVAWRRIRSPTRAASSMDRPIFSR